MIRHAIAIAAASALLVACDSEPTGSGATSGGGGAGGASSSTTATTTTTGGGGDGGGGGAADVCGDGAITGDELCDDGNAVAGDGCHGGCNAELGFTCSGEPSVCETTCGDGAVVGDEACDDGDADAGDGCSDTCAIEDGYDCIASPSQCAPICGDGKAVGVEGCDDGGTDPLDGCDDVCAVEVGYACGGEPSVCATVCGDALIAGLEECDDADVVAGNGCDDLCLVEDGWLCTGEPSACTTMCGDGVAAGLETCDDGGTTALDGCDDLCLTEAGYTCTGSPSGCVTTCGDSVVAGAEACDDGGSASSDGCDSLCAIEPGYTCMGAPSACATTCGDGVTAGAEACDDQGVVPLDGCDSLCAIEPGYTCMGAPSACATTCGDGVMAGLEACDDFNAMDDDGCSSACNVEPGFGCVGATPSFCSATCGDSFIAGPETCDDGGVAPNDGCSAACAIESGWMCAATPSLCSPVCGDGNILGGEACDDGNTNDGDGCSASCALPTGETCLNPLTTAQATLVGGAYQWDIAASSVVTVDDLWACDPNGVGPDVVVAYTKTSGTLAQGGELLYALATTGASTSTSNYLNLQIVSAGCDSTVGVIEKCLWYKHDWATFLDVPAGDYFIWISKNSAATASLPFPATTLTVDEVPASAGEGEGCFAPYTIASSVYTPPLAPGAPHTWTIPASINSFDMGVTWGGPGSISCDDHATYGDIIGVDAVIEFPKSSASSIIQVQVDNLDPSLTTSDLDVEILASCDATLASNTSYGCAANADSIALTGGGSQGNVYVWVGTEATSEEFDGASVQITELFPGIGESRFTPEPLVGSGAITPDSTLRLDAPSCFGIVGNIHWYSYTTMNEAFAVAADNTGFLAVLDAGGNELGCVTNAQATPFAQVGVAGATYLIAVETATAVTSLTITDFDYTGVGGAPLDTGITFPSSATTDYGMASDGTQIAMGGTTTVFVAPIAGNTVATAYGSAQGVTSTALGYDLLYVGADLFSVDTTTSTSASRLFKIYDSATQTWGATAWDTTPTYPSSASTYAMAYDGFNIILSTKKSSGTADFYMISPLVPGTPIPLGTSTSIDTIVGMAADSQYFYVAADGQPALGEGVFRIDRANIPAAALQLASLDTSAIHNGMGVDAYTSPQHLYVREYGGDIHAFAAPASASPLHVGVIATLGGTGDYGMTFDIPTQKLFFFETETLSTGVIRVMQ